MPTRIPYQQAPQFGFPPDTDPKLKNQLEDWQARFDAEYQQNWRAVELLPIITHSRASTIHQLDTASTLLRGLQSTVLVPQGAVVYVRAFIHFVVPAAAEACIGELYVNDPTDAANVFSIKGFNGQQAVLGADNSTVRATVAQQWFFENAAAGVWKLEVRGRTFATGSTAEHGIQSVMSVEVR